MVSSAIWKKHARVSFSTTIEIARVRRKSAISDVFEKLTSASMFFQIAREYYYLLITYMKKFRVNYIFMLYSFRVNYVLYIHLNYIFIIYYILYIHVVPYTTRLLQLGILPLTFWHEYLDLVLLYKIINGYTYIDNSARPTMAGSGITRSESNENVIKFSIPFANTVTFQTSYFIRACKTWNTLSCDLRHRDIGLNTFKSKLKTYYKHALSKVYNCDDPRTWKSICVKCRRARSLDGVLRYC